MRKFLNFGKYLSYLLFFIALSLPLSYPGAAAGTSMGGDDITLETDMSVTDSAYGETPELPAPIPSMKKTQSSSMMGSGTESDPYQVATAEDLDNVRNDLDAYYIQVAGIDLSEYESWVPIGEEYSNYFEGVYDGNNYEITNLTIDCQHESIELRDGRGMGLFGDVSEGILRNITIRNASIINTSPGEDIQGSGILAGGVCEGNVINCHVQGEIVSSGGVSGCGGLIGGAYNFQPLLLKSGLRESPSYGYIKNCSADVNITAGENTFWMSGGLVGYVGGSENDYINIEDCYAVGSLISEHNQKGSCEYIGGLIGSIRLAEINRCYSSGDINNVYNNTHGGFIGYTSNTVISQCYSTGDVYAKTFEEGDSLSGLGGFIGEGWSSSIDNCYSTGNLYIELNGDPYDVNKVGGFKGELCKDTINNCYTCGEIIFNYIPEIEYFWVSAFGGEDHWAYYPIDSTVTNCYYDCERSLYEEFFAEPKTTAEMKTQSTFEDWDFGTIWVLDSENDGYPHFIGIVEEPDKSTLGKRPYIIYGNGSVNLSTGNFILEQTDLAMPSIGPSLEFTRFYNSKDTYEGPQGQGWTHNYNTHLTINPDQSVNVAYADGQELQFTYNGSGYDRPAGCFEILEAGPDSTYIQTFKNQTKYTYNSDGRLISITDKNSNTLTLTYTDGLLTTAAEPGGRSLTFSYNEENLIYDITDSAGRSVSYTYEYGQLATIEDVRDYTIQYQYDEQGLSTIIDPDNITILHNDYDSGSRVTSQTDGRGSITGFYYDLSGRQTTVTDAVYQDTTVSYDEKYRSTDITYPGSITETFAYDNDNCRTQITDGRGFATHYNYDNFGNLLELTDPAENTTTMTYDDYNNLISVTNAVYKQITFDYDAANNLKTMEDPFGNITTYDYESNGLLKSITTPPGEAISSGITAYTYLNGQLQTVTDAVYNTTTFSYDDYGYLHTITDAANKTTTINCDAAGNITGVTDPLGNTTSYTYDWRGNALTRTDARDYLTQYFYNEVGQLSSVLDALDNETLYGYNALNQLETVTDPRGGQTTYSYDDLGRLITITDPLGHTAGLQYDNAGNPTGRTDAYGRQVLTVGYDSRNNPVAITDALGNTANNTYTNLNSLATYEDPEDNTTTFYYDDLNRLVHTTDATELGQGSQTFDAHGNRTEMVDPNENTTGYSFDPSDRVKNITTAADGSTEIEYNSRNLISWKKNARGQETNYHYYDNGRLHYFTNPDGTTTYTYDENGSLLTAGDSSGTITYSYDELNRVIAYTDPSGGGIAYTYDENSNLKTITYPGGKQVIYDYNLNNQLVTVTDWEDRITTYEYDHNGRLILTARPDGSAETREYYDNGKLKQLKDVDADNDIISQYDYTYDAAGNIINDNNSNEAGPYTFDSAALTYDADNRLGTYNGHTVTYDADGNMTRGPLAGDMENFTFDARSRLTGAGDTSYTYDAGNKRISVSHGTHQTTYVVNPNAYLSQVLTATDESDHKTYYVYGLGLIGQESAGGAYRSYHFDHLGSTIALTGESGSVTDRFQYAPYGELIYRSGNTATPFLYNGQYGVMTDAGDLYYMRARYYNPIAKRFLSPDTLVGQISNPQSQNRYVYCEGNPANYVDPTGHIPSKDVRTAIFILLHPDAAMKIGYVDSGKGKLDITNNSVRFSNNELGLYENDASEGSQVNAFRHALWQATITRTLPDGEALATEIGNAHENNPYAIDDIGDLSRIGFTTLSYADEACDLVNNRIGREIGKNANYFMRDIAIATLDYYHEKGLWVAVQQYNGSYTIVQERLSDEQYQKAYNRLNELDNNGYTKEQGEEWYRDNYYK